MRFLDLLLLAATTLVSARPAANPASAGKDTRITPAFKASSSSGLVHPGGVMGAKELAHLRSVRSRSDSNTQTAFRNLQGKASLSFTPSPQSTLTTDWNSSPGAKDTHERLQQQSGIQSYQQTIMFQITGNEQYAKNVLSIVSKWMAVNNGAGPSFTLKMDQENTPLILAWTLANWMRSLEILKHTWSNWSDNKGDAVVKSLLDWISAKKIDSVAFGDNEVLMSSSYSKNTPMGNWHTSILEAKLYLAFLRDDKDGVEFVYNYYKRMVNGLKNQQGKSDKIYIGETGELFESCRDMDHASYNIGGLVQLAEALHHQPKFSDDLYLYNAQDESSPSNGRSGLENVLEMYAETVLTRKMAVASNGNVWVDRPVDVAKGFIHGPKCAPKDLNWGNPMAGGYQMAYHHYVERLKRSKLPQLTMIAKKFPDSAYFHWGLGSLTHAGAP